LPADRPLAPDPTSRASITTTVALYALLWVVSSFNPIATFRSALAQQRALVAQHHTDRPYPWTIWFDLLDFALGFGWTMLLPIAWGVARTYSDRSLRSLIIVALGLPILVAMTGLLQSETSRVWNFMLPLVLLPAAIELSHWPRAARAVAYLAMLILMLAIGHNMVFMLP